MTTKWIKSLHCKSNALDDVVHSRYHRKIHHNSLANSSSCKNGARSLRDVVEIAKQSKSKTGKPPKRRPQTPPPSDRPVLRRSGGDASFHRVGSRSSVAESLFPSLTELPQGHPSRNVVEIIFHSSWGEKQFSGRVEMVFKIQNTTRTVTRFEEYREIVKSRASCTAAGDDGGDDRVRCVADGNEVMRFYCLGTTAAPAPGGAYEAGCEAWAFHCGKGAAMGTFPGSGSAHENAGGGTGRRAMLVCRVVAGRICSRPDFDSLLSGYDSESRGDGELRVFDSRALLPCFLIIYKV